ncbi:MAG TPA: APC family permease [Actinomycetes bacterium]|jgi:amino acid transporter|nr:APC family permease [Actinomycetes bacterium]
MDQPVLQRATVQVDDRQLLKALHWYDGFVVCLANPGFLIASLGASIGTLGALGAFVLWTLSMLIGVAQNKIYSEPATMFPDRSGGIPIYAHEGWRRYCTFVGPMAAIGYWAGWTVVLAINGLVIGSLVQAQWFPNATWTIDVGVTLTLPRLIAILLIVAVWAFNALGVKPALWVAYVTAALLVIPLALFMIFPYLTGYFRPHNLTWLVDDTGGSLGNSWRLALVWFYLMGWSSYGVESAATFAPEYQDPEHDTALALRRSAAFSLVVYALLPLGVGGVLSADKIAAGAVDYSFYVAAINKMIGVGANFILPLLIAAFILAMNTATMDGSRALYGISKTGMTIKWLGRLNRFHVPARAMTVDMVVNIVVVLTLTNTIAILAASNLGYILCHVFALTAILLLRRDLATWPRPLPLSSLWLWVAGILAAANLAFVLIGAPSFSLTGYGGYKELLIGLLTLVAACVLYAYRRVAEDREPLRLRDLSPTSPMPTGVPATEADSYHRGNQTG